MVNITQALNKIYNDPKSIGGFGGVLKLYKAAKKTIPEITIKDVKDYLKTSNAYTLHLLKKRKFKRRRILAPRPKAFFTSDLADMTLLAKHNNDIKYLLVCVDIFSRFAHVVPLSTKSGQSVSEAMKAVLDLPSSKGVRKLNTDKGGEFYNKYMKRLLDSKNIDLYSVFSQETKASIAERFIRTLKTKIYKYLTAYNTLTYINVLPDMVKTYNRTPHRGLKGKIPIDVHALSSPQDVTRQFKLMYKGEQQTKPRISNHLSVGDTVRLALSNRISKFKRGFHQQNTKEIFTIAQIDTKQPVPLYYLKDLNNRLIEGGFYREELTPTYLSDTFEIERIISKRKVGNTTLYKVRYVGYDSSFDQWVNSDDVKKL